MSPRLVGWFMFVSRFVAAASLLGCPGILGIEKGVLAEDGGSSGTSEEADGGGTADPQAERKAVMNALRAVVKPQLANQDIVFNVSRGAFKIESGWCWLQGTIELLDGGMPTTRGTPFEEVDADGQFDGFHVEALLEKRGETWLVLEHGVGRTDVWWDGIEQRYPDAPRSIFPWIR